MLELHGELSVMELFIIRRSIFAIMHIVAIVDSYFIFMPNLIPSHVESFDMYLIFCFSCQVIGSVKNLHVRVRLVV